MRLWFEAVDQILTGKEDCFWHISISHLRYITYLHTPLKYQDPEKEWKVDRTSTMLNFFLGDDQLIGGYSALKDGRTRKSWY